ncbi:MAG: hypothetical protein JO352_31845 [Chloroflexi bacterium]|nr:hypothetical protein [Chloroflexota bacterium]MBV9602633.1 hypothetical protein [Chloroflexota bacterium]
MWLRQHWGELLQYNFQWVASDGVRLLAHDADLQVVINAVNSEGLASIAVYALIAYDEVQRR